jgi:N-acyl-L-homoserine lactone synthetase
MSLQVEFFPVPLATPTSRSMHRERKRVFHDIMRWDVPIVDRDYEVDQFDTKEAVYFLRRDDSGNLLGSLRLLSTERSHMLTDVFAYLCDVEIPTGPNVWEITRACVTPTIKAIERLRVRNQLTSALVDYALVNGIDTYTCVCSAGWLAQMLALGWVVEPLGLPRPVDGVLTAALKIQIDKTTPRRLRLNNIYAPTEFAFADAIALAA